MNYATIKYCDVANGPGVRTSLFVSGCTHHCPGCFNEIAWDFSYGETFTEETASALIDSCRAGYVRGLTLLGGEPMEPANQRALLPFLQRFRSELPNKTVWCYSGYTLEELTGAAESRCRCEVTDEMLRQIDVLVDGRFMQEQHSVALRFRGSANQRILDLPATLRSGTAVLWTDQSVYATHAIPDTLR